MQPRLLQDAVTRQAERRPQSTAVVMGESRLSYRELEASSNRLAGLLAAAGLEKGDRVALFLPKSPAALLAMLGTLKAGGIYVPIDLQSPAARVLRIVEAAEPRLVLAAGPAAGLLDEVWSSFPLAGSMGVGWLGTGAPPGKKPGKSFTARFTLADLESQSEEPPPIVNLRRGVPSDPAHLLFTSGSTGAPKGVVITHSSVIHFLDWALKHFGTSPSDRISGHPPLHFDLSTFDIHGTFAAGAELHLVPPELNLLPQKLSAFIRDSRLTQWFSVPSILTYMAKFDVVREGDFPDLERLLWCGEVLPTPTLIYWMERLPHVAFTNLYGPTEATIASSFHDVPVCPPDGRTPIPIGTACDGEDLLVLDGSLRPVPPGETGDLYIRGVGLSPGYWRDPEKTRAAFIPHPSDLSERIYRTGDLARLGEDGRLYFLGRADTQIKSRGYRIELGEIEAALNSLHLLKESAVVAVETGGFEGSAICCAYVLKVAGAGPSRLREELQKLLPSYMLPSRWRAFEELPKNQNGKIDRRRLKELFEENPQLQRNA